MDCAGQARRQHSAGADATAVRTGRDCGTGFDSGGAAAGWGAAGVHTGDALHAHARELLVFKKTKLSTKIALGFGTLVIIAIGLGGMAAWSMTTAQSGAESMASEYVPEVAVASEIERETQTVMLEFRQYGLTEDARFYDTGMAAVARLRELLTKAQELGSQHPNLAELKRNADAAIAKTAEYEQLVVQTKALVDALAADRTQCDTAAGTFVQNAQDFLASQNEAFGKDVASGAAAEALQERMSKVTWGNDVLGAGNAVRLANFRAQALRDPSVIAAAQGNFDLINQKLDALKAVTRQEANLRQIDETRAAAAAYRTAMNNFVKNWTELQALGIKRGQVGDEVAQLAQKTAEHGVEIVTAMATQSAYSLARSTTVLLVGLAIGAAVGVLLAVFITRGITRSLTRIIENLDTGASQVNEAAGQVAAASQQLAEGASEQASSLEETSSALEEMAAMTRTNAENAQKANELSTQAQKAASTGDETMGRLNSAMQAINESSNQISKIIKVIEEIAFQTNLLALNAAVEAARAGEHGKGFAVVADEVRNLAMRAAQAARETTDLIESSVQRAAEGTDVASEVGKGLAQIVEDVSSVSTLINGIARASEEQAQGVEQVNTAVSQMDKVTQQNAANAEESSSAAQELSAQALTMKGVVEELVAMVRGSSGPTSASATRATPTKSPAKRATITSIAHHTPVTTSHDSHSTDF